MLGAVVEKVSGKRLGAYLAEHVWVPLKMVEATFQAPSDKRGRLAEPFPNNPLDGKPQDIIVIKKQTTFDCGGACALGTIWTICASARC